MRNRIRLIGVYAFMFAVLHCFVPDGASAITTAGSASKNEGVLIAIDGMHCTSCAKGIKAMLKRTSGVVSAEVSFERREADVEYDPSLTSRDKIVEAINNMGYKARVKSEKKIEQAHLIEVSAQAAGNR